MVQADAKFLRSEGVILASTYIQKQISMFYKNRWKGQSGIVMLHNIMMKLKVSFNFTW